MYLVEVTQYDVINWYMQVPDASTELGAMGGTFGFHLVTSPLAVAAIHGEVVTRAAAGCRALCGDSDS